MKLSTPLIAMAVVAVLPLSALAGDKDNAMPALGTSSSAQFAKLDTNRDGRISQAEAAGDPKLVFATADKNGDGYLDISEYSQRDMSKESAPNSTEPATDTVTPRP